MQICARRLDTITIFDVTGNIDLASSPDLRKALLHEIQVVRRPRVVLNLTAVGYMDSSGLASLIEGLKASRDLGLRFVLYGLNDTVRQVIHISKLTSFFEIHETEDESVAP